jgi:hypothetical protein
LDKTGAKPYELAKTLAYESGPAVTWLQNKFKLDLSLVSRLGGHSFPRTHRGKEKFPGMTITMALLEALKSPAFYIGAIGSRKNNDARRKRLAEFDLSQEEIARLHGPVGLKIGSKTPPEIAVAILAEMTAIRNGVDIKTFAEPPKATTQGCAIG